MSVGEVDPLGQHYFNFFTTATQSTSVYSLIKIRIIEKVALAVILPKPVMVTLAPEQNRQSKYN